MALQDLATNLNAALSQLYAPKVIRAFNRISILSAMLPKAPGRGKNVAWDVYVSGNSAASYTDGADVATYDVDTPLPATLSWGLYRQSFQISGLAQAAAASSYGSADELIALIDTSASNSAMKLVSTVNADLFTGSGANAITGLSTALAATGTYAGIAKGTYAEWAGNVYANGGVARNLTKDLMDQTEAGIYTASSLTPDCIVASPGVVRKFESLFDQMNRVILAGGEVSTVQRNVGSGAVLPDAVGWTGLSYKGIPVYRDRNCPTGTMYMLNRSMIQLQYLPQPSVNTAAIAQDRLMQGLPDTNMVGLAARLEAMAKTGDADKFTMKIYLQLAVLRPNTCGVIQDISEV
ncbi:MAG: hypothetical protein NVS3B7_10100 [Candidatus Elarobacter sp.]